MIEIFLLRAFYKQLAAIAEEKNRPRSWGWLGVVLWFLGEVLGFVVAGVARVARVARVDGGGASYLAALVCALCGGAVAFVVVKGLSPLAPGEFPVASIHKEG